jgi:hypothetical protein
MAVVIEQLIEEALQDIVQADIYVSTNSIPTVRYRDRNTDRKDQHVIVHAADLERIAPNANLYTATCRVGALSPVKDDLDGSELDDVYQAVYGTVHDMTTTTLQAAIAAIAAASGITIDGIVIKGGSQFDDDQVSIMSIDFDLFFTYVKPS